MLPGATPIIQDLSANGAKAVTPGAGGTAVMTYPTPRVDVRANWPRALGIMVHGSFDVTNEGGGTAAMPWTDFPAVYENHEIETPLFGTTHKAQVFQGLAAKHIVEFVSLGYQYADAAVASIPINTEDPPVTIEVWQYLPFAQCAFVQPLDFCPWIGWLANLQLTVQLASSPFDVNLSLGVTYANPSIDAYIESVPTKRPVLHSVSQWTRYEPPAAGGQDAILQNVGSPNGLTCVVPGSRIAGIYECLSYLGGAVAGTSDAEAYTSFACSDLGQQVTVHVNAFFRAYKRAMYERGAPISGNTANTDAWADGAGNPNTQTTGSGNETEAMFIPWRTPPMGTEIGKHPKYSGNLTLQRTFSDVPDSGIFPIYLNELRQLNQATAAAMLDIAQIPRAKWGLLQKLGTEDAKVRGSGFGMPITIPVD